MSALFERSVVPSWLWLLCIFSCVPAGFYGQISASQVSLSYKQGETGNCPSVAITKLIIASYGVHPKTGAFATSPELPSSEGLTSITMPDNNVVIVTGEQLSAAAEASLFNPERRPEVQNYPNEEVRQDVLSKANLIYAALAVRTAGQYNGAKVSSKRYRKALKTLAVGGNKDKDGMKDVDALFELFGYTFLDEPTFPNKASANVFGNGPHVAFAINDHPLDAYGMNYYDDHGTPTLISVYAQTYKDGGPVWRYALNHDLKITRQCQKPDGIWDSCVSPN